MSSISLLSAAEKNYGDTNFITGMRAFAAFAVVLIHAGGGGLRAFGEIGNRIVDFGAQGVAVFFVISGYSVASSYVTSNSYVDYINKRLWRISPLYYFWIGFTVLTATTATYWQHKYGAPVDAYNLLMHFSYLSFLDYRIANTILGVEWTIPLEVFWYLWIPLFMMWMVSRKHLVIAGLIAITCYVGACKYQILLDVPSSDAALAMHWSPIPYALGFFLGIAAFRLRESGSDWTQSGNVMFISAMGSLVVFALLPVSKSGAIAYLFFSALTFTLIISGSNDSSIFRRLFTNRIVMFLGTISYGVYLSHLPLLAILARLNLVSHTAPGQSFFILSGCAILVSSLTYYAIERPGQLFGKVVFYRVSKWRGHQI